MWLRTKQITPFKHFVSALQKLHVYIELQYYTFCTKCNWNELRVYLHETAQVVFPAEFWHWKPLWVLLHLLRRLIWHDPRQTSRTRQLCHLSWAQSPTSNINNKPSWMNCMATKESDSNSQISQPISSSELVMQFLYISNLPQMSECFRIKLFGVPNFLRLKLLV